MSPIQDEVLVAQAWHRGATVALGAAIVAYLAAALTPGTRLLEILFAVAAFLAALAYMGTTIWVYALRSERRREDREDETDPLSD